MGESKIKVQARCPECESWVALKDGIKLWELVVCPTCDTELEVIGLSPVALDYAEGEYYDDDDYDDDYDYEEDDDEDY